MLVTSHRKKNLLDYIYIYKKNFSKQKKSHFFLKCLIQPFDQKSQILLYLDLAIIRLEKLLSHFAEKKETCFDYKKQNFSKSKKSAFPKGLTHAFGQKMPFFSPVIFGKIRLEIMHNYFEEKKETFLTTNSRIFQTPKSRFFFKGVNP